MEMGLPIIKAWEEDCYRKGKVVLVVCQSISLAIKVHSQLGPLAQLLTSKDLQDLSQVEKAKYIDAVKSKWVSQKSVLVGTSGLITGHDCDELHVVIGLGALYGMNDVVQFMGRPGRTTATTSTNPATAILFFSNDNFDNRATPLITDSLSKLLVDDKTKVQHFYNSEKCLFYELGFFFDSVPFTCANESTGKCSNCGSTEIYPEVVMELDDLLYSDSPSQAGQGFFIEAS